MRHASSTRPPFLLLILDGWGHASTAADNAIAQAHTPHWDALWQDHPHSLLQASGHAVGLPDGQMGNSEVGHIHIGSGRHSPQDLLRINQAIASGTWTHNTTFRKSLNYLSEHRKRLHILGLLSPGGVHSHEAHIHAAIDLAATHPDVPCYLHALLDGRDTPPRSATSSLQTAMQHLQQHPHGHLASITGRFYAMDRDQRWARTQAAYDMLTQPSTTAIMDPIAALQDVYSQDISDEFCPPTALDHAPIEAGDVVWFVNFRADRARQLSQALGSPGALTFNQAAPALYELVTLTDYGANTPAQVAFPKPSLEHTLGACLAAAQLRQLRIAETEKYAHVTYFFNGGQETPFTHETRTLIPSPKVKTYDLAPAMSVQAVTEGLLNAITTGSHDVIIANFANADMVGHTGDLQATIQAVESIDACLGRILNALDATQGQCLITADHGNAECMHNAEHQQAHTAHTTNPVPLVYHGPRDLSLADGELIDIAPTVLHLLDLPQPPAMTGRCLAKDA